MFHEYFCSIAFHEYFCVEFVYRAQGTISKKSALLSLLSLCQLRLYRLFYSLFLINIKASSLDALPLFSHIATKTALERWFLTLLASFQALNYAWKWIKFTTFIYIGLATRRLQNSLTSFVLLVFFYKPWKHKWTF